jgi:hypothetical protein
MVNGTVNNVPAKVFLRRKGGLYYTWGGGWTPTREAAKDFEDAAVALVFARASWIEGLEIVIATKIRESSLAING